MINLKVIDTAIPEVKILEPIAFHDSRGFFYESFNQESFNKVIGKDVNFVQDNHSRSGYGVLRGLHYQLYPTAQAKLVRVACGEVFDVAVDLRKNSKTFLQSVSVVLSAENKRQLWIPEGFAHAFLTLSPSADFLYKTTNFYNKSSERSVQYLDPTINISWPIDLEEITTSEKDKKASFISDLRKEDFFD